LTCPSCETQFSSVSCLNRHLKSAKYCSDEAIGPYKCGYCDYITPLKHTLTRHLKGCKTREKVTPLEEQIETKNELIAFLEDQFEELHVEIDDLNAIIEEKDKYIKTIEDNLREFELKDANSGGKIEVYKDVTAIPKTLNQNKTIINTKLANVNCDTIRPFTEETVREDISAGKYTYEHFINAEKGLLDFIADIIVQDEQRNYVCTDYGRVKFLRLLTSRDWKEDNGATFLNKVLDELKEQAQTHHKKILDMFTDPEADKDTAEFLTEKTKLMVRGILNSKSKDRDKLFTKLRNKVRDMASI